MAEQVIVSFPRETQNIESLRAAAYRLIGTATCEISEESGNWICRLEANSAHVARQAVTASELKVHFLNLVTDENLRLQIEEKTEPVRNLILSLAFGALAQNRKS